ncbi:hypothetical protein IKX73_00580 [Candidatus Saccharibacteria bacterium]|nr:hypothetical protein [Candidatus Saccharibacteria bacterium]
MKRLTLLALALVGSLCGYSQMIEYPKNQVSAFYCEGKSLYSALLEFWGLGIQGLLNNDGDEKKGDGEERLKYTDFSGTYNVEYLHNFFKPWMSIGTQLGYEEIHSKHWLKRSYSPSQPNDLWTEKERTLYIMCVAQFDLLRYNWVGLYTKVGEGVRLIFTDLKYNTGKTDDDFGLIPCFVVATGLEVGPKFVRFFGELGIGAQGFASVGLRARF